MLFCPWLVRIFVYAAVFFPRDTIDLAGWFVLLAAVLALAPPDLFEITFRDWDDE